MGKIVQQQQPTNHYAHKNVQNAQPFFEFLAKFFYQDKDDQLCAQKRNRFDHQEKLL